MPARTQQDNVMNQQRKAYKFASKYSGTLATFYLQMEFPRHSTHKSPVSQL